LQDGPDFLPLGDDERVVDVAVCLDVGEGLDGFLRAPDFGEPAWGFWEEGETDEEEDCGDELDSWGRRLA